MRFQSRGTVAVKAQWKLNLTMRQHGEALKADRSYNIFHGPIISFLQLRCGLVPLIPFSEKLKNGYDTRPSSRLCYCGNRPLRDSDPAIGHHMADQLLRRSRQTRPRQAPIYMDENRIPTYHHVSIPLMFRRAED